MLLVNDLVAFGGTEVQHWREFDLLQERGHDVYSFTMDPAEPERLDGHKRNLPIDDGVAAKALARYVSGVHYRRLAEQIDGIAPDVIHLNNVRKAPLDIYRIARRYPCLQTVRDYGAVCPKGTCIHADYKQCDGFAHERCQLCGLGLKDSVKATQMVGLTRANLAACELRVAPSEALARCCTANGLPTGTLNDPFDFSKIAGDTGQRDVGQAEGKVFLYFGSVDWNKGIGQLIEAFDEFAARHQDARLQIAGKIAPGYEEDFRRLKDNKAYIEYLGMLPNDTMLERVSQAFCVVAPSLCIENYPNTVLETMACKTLAIGTNRGGIPEMLRRDELFFDVLDKASIVQALERVYAMSGEERQEIVEECYERVALANTTDVYLNQLEDLFEEAERRFVAR